MHRNRHDAGPSTPDIIEPAGRTFSRADRTTIPVNWAALTFMAAYALGILAGILEILLSDRS